MLLYALFEALQTDVLYFKNKCFLSEIKGEVCNNWSLVEFILKTNNK